jgi:hypothetical protein
MLAAFTRSLPVTGLLLAAACGLVQFDVEVEAETVVERGTLVEQLIPVVFDDFAAIDLAESQEFQNRDVRPDQVESIRIRAFVLEITDPPDGQDFSFLRALSFFIDTDGQPRRRIATAPDGAFDAGVRRIELDIDDVELQPYATAEHFSLDTEVTASRRPSVDTTIQAHVVFRVKPNL